MKSLFLCLVLVVSASALFAGAKIKVEHNLGISVFSPAEITGIGPSMPITYAIRYNHRSEQGITNVTVKDVISKSLTYQSATPAPTLQRGDTLIWNFASMKDNDDAEIEIKAMVKSTVAVGTEILNTALIMSPFAEDDSSDNASESVLYVETPLPDLSIAIGGALETPEGNATSVAEEGMPVTLTLWYANNSMFEGSAAVVTDTLPANSTFISAEPAPASRNGRVLTWNVDLKNADDIKITFRAGGRGTVHNSAVVRCSKADRDSSDNAAEFEFEVVPVLEPVLTMPSLGTLEATDTVLTARNPQFQGFARAGSTVSLYEIDPEGCYEPLASRAPVLRGRAVADAARRWTITPTTMTDVRPYHLVLQADYKGSLSLPGATGDYWYPFVVAVDPYIDSAGIDMNYFTISYGGQTYHPGAFGTVIGVPPDVDVTYSFRLLLTDEILKDTSSWEMFALRSIRTIDGETTEEMIMPSRVFRDSSAAGKLGKTTTTFSGGTITVEKGTGPGSKVETWGHSYTFSGGKVKYSGFRKLSSRVIDPAGFVYDLDAAHKKFDWPAVPPAGTLITNAKVTALERTGDSSWVRWPAETFSQVNPQVTDAVTKDSVRTNGYFSFLVPPGQYRVSASAPGYMEYASGVLTVVNEPVYHNAGMRRVPSVATGVYGKDRASAHPERWELFQNYPNPFNPTTLIAYSLPAASKVSIVIYDMLGREVSTILDSQREEAGLHRVQFDAGRLASGTYFYRIRAGEFMQTRKMLFVK